MSESRNHVRIRDVAEIAGVSPTTVSHALSGNRRVKEATRLRILAVAEQLGYRANALAQSLASRWNGLLALQVSAADGPPLAISDIEYFSELVNAAALRALDLGYWLALAPPVAPPDSWRRLHPDGAIVVDARVGDPLVDLLTKRKVPFVTAGRNPNDEHGYWVGSDHPRNTTVVLEHLKEAGARSIALVTGPLSASYTIDTHAAYLEWAQSQKGGPQVAIAHDILQDASGEQAALELLARRPRPDGIYATLDRLALGTLRAARRLSITVPDELRIAGLADGYGLRHADPPLTTLHLSPTLVGSQATELLIDLVEGRKPARRHRIVPSSLIVRGSTIAQSTAEVHTAP